MKLNRTTWARTKVVVATAIAVPLMVGGGMVAANAVDAADAAPDPATSTGTAQLTEEGLKLAGGRGSQSSGTMTAERK